jgi:hypothetical protein
MLGLIGSDHKNCRRFREYCIYILLTFRNNCENEEELLELLDDKLEKAWSEGDETFDELSNDEIDLIKYWENEEFNEGAMTVKDFCDRRFKTLSSRYCIRRILR